MTTVLRSWLCRMCATLISSSLVSGFIAALTTKSSSDSCSTRFRRPPPNWIIDPRKNRSGVLAADADEVDGGGDERQASPVTIGGTVGIDWRTRHDGGGGGGGGVERWWDRRRRSLGDSTDAVCTTHHHHHRHHHHHHHRHHCHYHYIL